MFLLKGRAQIWIPALLEASPALRTASGLWFIRSRWNVPVCSLVFLLAGKYHCSCIPPSLPKSCSPVSCSTQDYHCQTLLLIESINKFWELTVSFDMWTDPLDLVSSMALKCTFILHHPVLGHTSGDSLSAHPSVVIGHYFLGTQLCAHLSWIHSDLAFSHLLTRMGSLESHVPKVQVCNTFLSTQLLLQI